ncbi:glutathione S-transferase 1-like [Dermacentor andersoni]|uniref:glutathione S-transferase 1-like n=1 Tax=Dermacentor andersoni TaxID=34620 RepID=UPI003B3AEE26
MAITLYNLEKSPPCAYVRSLAKHLDIELKLKNLDFAKKEHLSDEYLKINPFHKVPAIDDGGFIVYESNAIAYYLLRKYAPESKLYPTCIKTRTRIDQVLACLSTTIHSAMVAFLLPRFVHKTQPKTEEKTAFEDNVLRGLEHLICDKFAVGETFTLADVAMTSLVATALENNLVDYTKFPKLRSYYERLKHEQPCFEEIYGPVLNNMRQPSASLN